MFDTKVRTGADSGAQTAMNGGGGSLVHAGPQLGTRIGIFNSIEKGFIKLIGITFHTFLDTCL